MLLTRPLRSALALLVAVPVLLSGSPRMSDGGSVAPPASRDDTAGHGTTVRAAERSRPRAPQPRSSPTVAATRYPEVEALRPAIRVDPDRRLDRTDVGSVVGVRHVAEVRRGRILVAGPGGSRELTVAAVDPVRFRPLAPQVTADAVGVWERLDDGEAVFLHAAAADLQLALGGYARFGRSGEVSLRVGALATNGTPPVGDLLVTRATGARFGLDAVDPTWLVAVDEDEDVEDVIDRLEERIDGEVEAIPDPRQAHAVSLAQRRSAATVWDLLAMCESSGNWHIDSGNGFYGGLQFLPESWWMVGGRGLPHEASREEQIRRAELLLAIQGWEAWPVCSVKLGLRPPPEAG